ncbi:MAG TPA: hypothetical protein VIY09_06885, partial [Rhizomicrobium sp.]
SYPVPGNDDAARALSLYCELAARAIIDGLSESQAAAGVDVGEAEETHEQPRVLRAEPAEAAAAPV